MASHPLMPVRRRQASRHRKARRANPMWAIRARAERIWAFSTPVPGSAGRTRCVAPTMRCCAIPVSSASCKQFLCLRAGTSRARSCSAPISLSIRSGYDAPARPDSQGVPGPECPATLGLTHCQVRSQTRLHFHFHAVLTARTGTKLELRHRPPAALGRFALPHVTRRAFLELRRERFEVTWTSGLDTSSPIGQTLLDYGPIVPAGT